MRVLAALAVVQAIVTLANQTVQIPTGWSQVVVLVLGGLGLRWYFARSEKRLKDTLSEAQAAGALKERASAQEIYQRIERELALDTEAKIQSLRAELVAAVAEGARKDAVIHKLEAKVGLLQRRIERLSDQVLAFEAGEDPRKRRLDPPV